MKEIITVQHTQSVHHINGMVGSWTDWDLTGLGRVQADRIGKRLKEELAGKRVTVYASDLRRARQTAEEIAKYFGVEPTPRRELRERNLGRCCGKSVQWLRENLEGPEKTVDDRLFSDAESRRDAWNRLQPFFEEVLAGEEETVLLVSHGDLLSLWNAMFLGLAVESVRETEIRGAPGGVSWFFVDNDGRRLVRRIGDLSYLGAPTPVPSARLRLTPITEEHLEAFSGTGYGDMPREDRERMLRESRERRHDGRFFQVLALCDGDRVVGFFSLCAQSPHIIGISPEIRAHCRRQGYGFAGETLALAYARDRGYTMASAGVREENAASIALHEKLGFEAGARVLSRRGQPLRIYMKTLP